MADALTIIQNSDLGAMRHLLAKMSPNCTTGETKDSWLMHAVNGGDASIVSLLLDAKANVEYQNTNGMRAVDWANALPGIEKLQLLIDFKANVNYVSKTLGASPLLFAVQFADHAKTACLLKGSADPNMPGIAKPLAVAASYGNQSLVRILLEHKADPNTEFGGERPLFSAEGNRILDYAIRGQNVKLCRMLLEFDAELTTDSARFMVKQPELLQMARAVKMADDIGIPRPEVLYGISLQGRCIQVAAQSDAMDKVYGLKFDDLDPGAPATATETATTHSPH
jgi:ankyrin repeat protein